MNWPLAAILMALTALAVPDLFWGLVAVALITGLLTMLAPQGRRIAPLALVAFTVAAVAAIRSIPL